MSNRSILLIGGLLFVLMILSMSTCMEFKTVPKVNWNKQLKYEYEDPNGLSLVKSMFKELYGKENVSVIDQNSMGLDTLSNNNLYFYIARGNDISFERKDSILDWVKLGGQLVMVMPTQNFNFEYLDEDELLGYYDEDSIFYLDGAFIQDSTMVMNILSEDSIQQTLTYYNYGRSLDQLEKTQFHYFTDYNFPVFEPLISFQDTNAVFMKKDYGEGTIYMHSNPQMFVNVSGFQDFYLPHFNYVVSHFDPDKVYLDQRKKFSMTYSDQERESPIQYILATPQLKWAYYTIAGGLLLYLIFGSKRKQRAILNIEKNKNTSLEYVKTVSQLYESQNQNQKLVQQMQHIFFEKMKSKYFISEHTENYSYLLSRKSKVDKNTIDKLLKKLANSEHYKFNDEQLIALHLQLENFYKNCK